MWGALEIVLIATLLKLNYYQLFSVAVIQAVAVNIHLKNRANKELFLVVSVALYLVNSSICFTTNVLKYSETRNREENGVPTELAEVF